MKNLYSRTSLLILTVCLLSGCHKKKDIEAESDKPLVVSVLRVQTDSVMIRRTYPGVLQAANKADVVARVNGTILRRHFKAGDYVSKGKVLFTIESTIYEDAVHEASARINNASSAYDYASRQYAALKRAYESDAVAEMEVIKARSSMEQARAQIRQLQASLKDARTRLGYCTVRAPISGYISDAVLLPGSYVGGEDTPVTLASIYDNSKLQVTFSIPDGSYIEMFTSRAGNQHLNFNSIPISFALPLQHDYSGSISYLAPSVNTTTGSLELKANVANPYNELRDGMYATIALPLHYDPHAMLVRDASVHTDQRGTFLYTINDRNEVVYTPIKLGALYHDSLRVVESGVYPGTIYVSKAMLKVRPGMKVKPLFINK